MRNSLPCTKVVVYLALSVAFAVKSSVIIKESNYDLSGDLDGAT